MQLNSKAIEGNIAMFANLASAIKEDKELDEHLKTSITQLLQSLELSSNDIFLETIS